MTESAAVALVRARRSGSAVVTTTRNPGLAMEELMLMHGLQPRPSALVSITLQAASDCITALLWKDLAYSIEIMPLAQARALADMFVATHASGGALCFSNADWSKAHGGAGYTSDALTDATFSATVLMIHSDHAVSLTIEDED